jgi:hypothetical protein
MQGIHCMEEKGNPPKWDGVISPATLIYGKFSLMLLA